jgi:hypothetical protein
LLEDSEDLTANFMRLKRSFPNRFAKIFYPSQMRDEEATLLALYFAFGAA